MKVRFMRLCIIETGAPPQALQHQYGSYAGMFERMLGPISNCFQFSRLTIEENYLPPLLSDVDGLLFTGSPAGVYEDHRWIKPLETLIRDAAAAGKPQVGICFGHQIMTQAFGGKVEKSHKGWGIGLHAYDMISTREWMVPQQARVACAVSHQDQVTSIPPGAKLLAGSGFCPSSMIEYAQGPAISFQMHPEFDHDFATALINVRAGRFPAPLVEEGLQSLKRPSDRAVLAEWIANFLLHHGDVR